MLALFFEVQPKPERLQEYLDTAAKLKPELDAVGGCLFIERFKSLGREGTLLSFQVWRDEAAMTAWRVNPIHHQAQTLAVGAQPTRQVEQQLDPGAVEISRLGEVEHQPGALVGEPLAERPPQLVGVDALDLTLDPTDQDGVDLVEAQLHQWIPHQVPASRSRRRRVTVVP